MKHGIQHKLAEQTGLSDSFICLLLQGKKRPSWKTSKALAEATGTTNELWLDGTPEQIRKALEELTIE